MMPRIVYNGGCWWGEIVTRKTKRAAQQVYRHFAEAPQPHRVAMSQLVYPDCGKRECTVWGELLSFETMVAMYQLVYPDCGRQEFIVWSELLAMDVMDIKTHGVPHFFN